MTNKKIKYQPVPPEISELVAEHGSNPEALLEVLVDLETHPIGLSPATVTDAARALKVPPHKAYGMATFYSMLSFEERVKVMRVCDGPVCWLKRATETQSALASAAGDDWTVERSSCLGLCGLKMSKPGQSPPKMLPRLAKAGAASRLITHSQEKAKSA